MNMQTDAQEIIRQLQRKVAEQKGDIEDLTAQVEHLTAEAMLVPKSPPMDLPDNVKFALTRKQYQIAELLFRRLDHVVSKDAVMAHLYGARADDPPDIKIVDIFICKLRGVLTALKSEYVILTCWGEGFMLTKNQATIDAYKARRDWVSGSKETINAVLGRRTGKLYDQAVAEMKRGPLKVPQVLANAIPRTQLIVMEALSERPGAFMTWDEIAAKLYDGRPQPATARKVVEVSIHHLRKTMVELKMPRAIVGRRSRGYYITDDLAEIEKARACARYTSPGGQNV